MPRIKKGPQVKRLLRPAKLQRRRSYDSYGPMFLRLDGPKRRADNACDCGWLDPARVWRGERHLSLTAPSGERTQGMRWVGPRIFSSTNSAKNLIHLNCACKTCDGKGKALKSVGKEDYILKNLRLNTFKFWLL